MEELKRRWFQIVWGGLVLLSVLLSWIERGVSASWAHSPTMEFVQNVLVWIVLPMTIVLFLLSCVENWRTGERYFWRKCRRWGGNLFLGALMAAVLLFVLRFIKSGVVFGSQESMAIVKTVIFWLLAIGGLLYLVAKYKFNRPKRDL